MVEELAPGMCRFFASASWQACPIYQPESGLQLLPTYASAASLASWLVASSNCLPSAVTCAIAVSKAVFSSARVGITST